MIKCIIASTETHKGAFLNPPLIFSIMKNISKKLRSMTPLVMSIKPFGKKMIPILMIIILSLMMIESGLTMVMIQPMSLGPTTMMMIMI